MYREFESGTHLTCEDQPRSGRPPTVNTPKNEERLQRLTSQSHSWTIDDLVKELQLSHGTVWGMLHKLGYRKIGSRYVPHELTSYQRQNKVETCRRHMDRYQSEPSILDRIIAIDETWLRSYDSLNPQSAPGGGFMEKRCMKLCNF